MIPKRIVAVRAYATTRLMESANCANAQLQSNQLSEIVNFDYYDATLLKTAIEHSCVSDRANHKIQELALTIADLNAESTISRTTIAEALAYRAMPLPA